MRFGTVQEARQFLRNLTWRYSGKDGKNRNNEPVNGKVGIAGWLMWGARITGCAMFVSAFATFAAPAVLGWSWLLTIGVFTAEVMLARQLMEFDSLWLKFSGTMAIFMAMVKGKTFEEYAASVAVEA